MTLPVVLRLAVRKDHSLIFSDWLRSGRSAKEYSRVASETYYYWHHRIIETLLTEPTATWVVACDETDPTKVFGWACTQRADTLAGDQLVLHYIYVKKNYRRLGVASTLLEAVRGSAAALAVTSLSDVGQAFLEARSPIFVFNPYLLWARVPAATGEGGKSTARTFPGSEAGKSRRALVRGGYVPGPSEDET